MTLVNQVRYRSHRQLTLPDGLRRDHHLGRPEAASLPGPVAAVVPGDPPVDGGHEPHDREDEAEAAVGHDEGGQVGEGKHRQHQRGDEPAAHLASTTNSCGSVMGPPISARYYLMAWDRWQSPSVRNPPVRSWYPIDGATIRPRARSLRRTYGGRPVSGVPRHHAHH